MRTQAEYKIKTIDINAREWFDKVNGNSYFSGTIVLNYGEDGENQEKTYDMPFQYGYGNHYIDVAGQELSRLGYIVSDDRTALWRYCKDNNIILRTNKAKNCLKREL